MTIAVAAPPDSVPPTISNVVAAAADGTATITWNTDEPSTSLVEFGLTATTARSRLSIRRW